MIIKGIAMKKILTMAGSFFVFLGILGIFLPVFPTVPFLVLALICYSKGSKRHYNWLISNRIFGKYIKDYKEGKGVPLYGKILGIFALWISITFSSTIVLTNNILRIILILIGIGVTMYILRLKTLNNSRI